MGCDYYTWLETIIEWKDLSGNLHIYIQTPEFEQYERHYRWSDSTYDADFEDPPQRDELKEMIWSYGEKIFYENGVWECKEAGKNRILSILDTKKIPLTSVLRVYKQMNGYWR